MAIAIASIMVTSSFAVQNVFAGNGSFMICSTDKNNPTTGDLNSFGIYILNPGDNCYLGDPSSITSTTVDYIFIEGAGKVVVVNTTMQNGGTIKDTTGKIKFKENNVDNYVLIYQNDVSQLEVMNNGGSSTSLGVSQNETNTLKISGNTVPVDSFLNVVNDFAFCKHNTDLGENDNDYFGKNKGCS